jgi:hypothetical protein
MVLDYPFEPVFPLKKTTADSRRRANVRRNDSDLQTVMRARIISAGSEQGITPHWGLQVSAGNNTQAGFQFNHQKEQSCRPSAGDWQ